MSKLQFLQNALDKEDFTQIQELAKQVISIYFETFHLSQKLITYNMEESQFFLSYLSSVELLLKCKQEAARLSPATWDVIESELLLPPDD